jgi:chlorobactene glucosyltransferase
MLFLDADTRLADGAVSGMLQAASERNLTLLSCWPGFHLVNFSERALMPMLNLVVFSIFPALLSLVRNDTSLGLAHGACLLAHRATYQKLGGHSTVRSEIFEDTRIAQLWRSRGERSLCLDGQDVVRVRMYSSFSEIWLGFQKNFFPAFQHESVFWLFLVFHFSVFLLPFLVFNWPAAVLILLARAVLAWRFSQPWWSVLAHPVAELLMLLLGISSWWNCRSGRGVSWKGRVYRARRV